MADGQLKKAVRQLQTRVADLERRIERLDPTRSGKDFDRPDEYMLSKDVKGGETKEEANQREFSNLIRQTGLEKAPKNEKLNLWKIYQKSGPGDKDFTELLLKLRDKYDDLVRPKDSEHAQRIRSRR